MSTLFSGTSDFWSLSEICLVWAALGAHLWEWWRWVMPHKYSQWARPAAPLLIAVVLAVAFVRVHESVESLGLSLKGIRSGWLALVVFTLMGLCSLVIVAGFSGGCGSVRSRWILAYIPGLIGQQIALQCFLNNRAYRVFSRFGPTSRLWLTVFLSTIMFSTMHLPNVLLVVFTFVAGIFWTWHFRRFSNLLALTISHLLLGAVAMMLMGAGPLQNLRVGWAFVEKMLR